MDTIYKTILHANPVVQIAQIAVTSNNAMLVLVAKFQINKNTAKASNWNRVKTKIVIYVLDKIHSNVRSVSKDMA